MVINLDWAWLFFLYWPHSSVGHTKVKFSSSFFSAYIRVFFVVFLFFCQATQKQARWKFLIIFFALNHVVKPQLRWQGRNGGMDYHPSIWRSRSSWLDVSVQFIPKYPVTKTLMLKCPLLAPLVLGPQMVWGCLCLCMCVHACVHACLCEQNNLKYALCWHIHISVHSVLYQCYTCTHLRIVNQQG